MDRSEYFNIIEEGCVIQVSLREGECNLLNKVLHQIYFIWMSLNSSLTFIKFILFQNSERENKNIAFIQISYSLFFPIDQFLFLFHSSFHFDCSILSFQTAAIFNHSENCRCF